MKRVFGIFEAVLDIFYLVAALILGVLLLLTAYGSSSRILAGVMAMILVGGDMFHLFPRILVIFTGQEEKRRKILGRGKQITSITMTVFYLLLWHIGLLKLSSDIGPVWSYIVYFLAFLRILLCLMPQNRWEERFPPLQWGILRNIPFTLLGFMTAILFLLYGGDIAGLKWMWLAILCSFLFYLPVVLWAHKNPKIGMLMLPKTWAYLWILAMCLSL